MSQSHRGAQALFWVFVLASACSTEPPWERYSTRAGSSGAPGLGAASGGTTAADRNLEAGADSFDAGRESTSEAASGGDSTEHTEGGAGGTGGDTIEISNAGAGPLELSCGAAPISEGAFTREALRAAAADCAGWHHCRFEAAATTLASRVEAYANTPADPELSQARDAWKAAMRIWSGLELFQFGPLSSVAEAAGKDAYQGQGIRDRVYSWPLTARCRVEEQLESQRFQSTGMDSVFVSGRGLYALEYLLFYPGSDTACTPSSPTGTAWRSLDPEVLAERKRAYAQAVATDISAQAATLRAAWDPNQGNFRETFVSASGYPSEQEAMNVLAWSLGYIEREVKDWKLGIPAGYTLEHPVGQAEAPHADFGTDNLRENLLGFQRLFQGCGENGEGLGFDDWLIEAGHQELAASIIRAWENAKAAVDRLPPLNQATASELEAAYQAVRVLTSLLKADFFGAGSPLNLKLPATVEGDTD